MIEKWKKEYFDEEFYECKTGNTEGGDGVKGGQRSKLSENEMLRRKDVANVIRRFFPKCKTWHQAGAGCGYIAHFLNEMKGVKKITASDISDYATKKDADGNYVNAVFPVRQCDIRELNKVVRKNSCDIVFCWNIIEYLPTLDEFRKGLKSMMNVSKDWVMLGLSTKECLELRPAGITGRNLIYPREFWEEEFRKTKGFEYQEDMTREFCEAFDPGNWRSSGGFILRKKVQ